jgi:alkaline phosphatase
MPRWRRPKLLGLFAPAELAFADDLESRSEQPSLPDMVRRAIELLQFNPAGYLLVVDVGLIRKAAQQNAGERTLLETLELDRAVAVALKYVGGKSSILVCGDVAVGGLSLNGFPFRQDSGVAVLGVNSTGDPWLTWATGPNGVKAYGAAQVEALQTESEPSPSPAPAEPAAVFAELALTSASDIAAFGHGLGAEALHGTLESTAIFELIRDSL